MYKSLVLFTVSGILWGSWNVSPMDKRELLCYILFTHASVDRYLDWFYVLDIMYNAAVSMGVQISLNLLSILLGIYQEVDLLDWMSFSVLFFLRTAILFSTAAVPFYIFPTSVHKVSNFFTSSLTVVIFWVFLRVGKYLIVVFICISLMINVAGHLYVFFGEKSFAHF